MLYEWDEGKREINLAKHGIDFTEIERFDWDNAVIVPSDRDGEERFVAYGYFDESLHAVVYTIRADRRRIISMRLAKSKEVNYET